jgi:hypothetical protein
MEAPRTGCKHTHARQALSAQLTVTPPLSACRASLGTGGPGAETRSGTAEAPGNRGLRARLRGMWWPKQKGAENGLVGSSLKLPPACVTAALSTPPMAGYVAFARHGRASVATATLASLLSRSPNLGCNGLRPSDGRPYWPSVRTGRQRLA